MEMVRETLAEAQGDGFVQIIKSTVDKGRRDGKG